MNFDIEDVMKFNVKDIKSWSNRHDVKVGAEGYFFNKISDLHDIEHVGYSKIERINDNQANCLKNKSSPLKEELKSCLGDACKIKIKSVEVTENE